MFNIWNLAVLAAALVPFGAGAPVAEQQLTPQEVPINTTNKYIVTLKPGIAARDIESHLSWVGGVHRRNVAAGGAELPGVGHKFDIDDFHAYAGTFDDATIEEIRNSPDVAEVEPDQIYTLSSLTSQAGATWGLASISSRTRGGTTYRYDTTAGAGAFIYVVDSGVRATHTELAGRVEKGTNVAGGAHTDTLGHGTHVSGTAAGRTYGVAKAATVVDVKVFTGRTAATSTILVGYSWAVNDVRAKGLQARAVINMSLGGPSSRAFDSAVESAYSAGVLSVVAAGNDNAPASGSSPAQAAHALTVGAVDSSWAQASYSNYGSAVKVLAPGSGIKSAWYTGDSATNTLDGTSMACPHVAGLAAYLAVLEDIATPAALTSRIVSLATTGAVQRLKSGTPNRIVNNGST